MKRGRIVQAVLVARLVAQNAEFQSDINAQIQQMQEDGYAVTLQYAANETLYSALITAWDNAPPDDAQGTGGTGSNPALPSDAPASGDATCGGSTPAPGDSSDDIASGSTLSSCDGSATQDGAVGDVPVSGDADSPIETSRCPLTGARFRLEVVSM